MASAKAEGAKEAASEAKNTQGRTQEDPFTIEDPVTKVAQVLSELKSSSNQTSPTKEPPSPLQKMHLMINKSTSLLLGKMKTNYPQ
ncbi:hypothetical protein SESBI_39287 [Sesbania bispinosa]|nr:hypothetical protein SESBI_39287 [Sesbania bispinosa]